MYRTTWRPEPICVTGLKPSILSTSGFASAAVAAYLVPFILAVLLVVGALISTIFSEPLT